jgi:hypothetical protein
VGGRGLRRTSERVGPTEGCKAREGREVHVWNSRREPPILTLGESSRRADGQEENDVAKAEARPSVNVLVRAEVVVQPHSTPL